MVSLRIVRFLVPLSLAGAVFAQESATPQPAAPPAPAPVQLTPEQRGDILMAHKKYREAIDAYRQAPMNSAIIWNKLGIAHHQLLLMDEAKKYYEKAIKLNPKYSEAINNLGTIHYSRKSYRRAVNQYKKALKITPKSASVYSNLGTAEFARKKYERAAEAYRMALSLDPEVFEHRGSYGTLLQERSVEEKARFHYYLAKTYAHAGILDRAIQYIRMALEEGFKDRKKLLEEPEFANIRETPEFQELLAYNPRVL
jgi:tetratricopeptide (TPR) repeat protein